MERVLVFTLLRGLAIPVACLKTGFLLLPSLRKKYTLEKREAPPLVYSPTKQSWSPSPSMSTKKGWLSVLEATIKLFSGLSSCLITYVGRWAATGAPYAAIISKGMNKVATRV